MLLSEVTLPVPYDECIELALVYPHAAAVALYELQQTHGDWRHVCYGRQRTDGTWMIDGEVLAMVGDGQPYAWIRQHVTPEIMAQIEVVPMSEAVALLPHEVQAE